MRALIVFLLIATNLIAQTDEEITQHIRDLNQSIAQLGENDYVFYLGPNSYLDYQIALSDYPELKSRIKVLNVTEIKWVGSSSRMNSQQVERFFDRMFEGVDLSKVKGLSFKRHLMVSLSMNYFIPQLHKYLNQKVFKGKVKLEFAIQEGMSEYMQVQRLTKMSDGQTPAYEVEFIPIVESTEINDRLNKTISYPNTYPAQALNYETLTAQDYSAGLKAEPKKAILPVGVKPDGTASTFSKLAKLLKKCLK